MNEIDTLDFVLGYAVETVEANARIEVDGLGNHHTARNENDVVAVDRRAGMPEFKGDGGTKSRCLIMQIRKEGQLLST